MTLPFVSVIVPTYRDQQALMTCLGNLAAQDYPLDLFEIIIINNDPTSHIEIQQLNCTTVLICESKPGSYCARNTGLNIAKGDVIAFIDSDCQPQASWISHGVQSLLRQPEVYRVAGAVELFKTECASNIAWRYEHTMAFNQKYNVSKGLSVTANLFVRKEAFSITGLFNENLMSGGDMEWNARATDKKLPIIFAPEAIVRHPARANMAEVFHKYRRISGGSFVRAQSEKRVISHLVRHFMPPISYCYSLIKDGKPLVDVLFGGFIFWSMKILALTESLHLLLGKKPLR